MGFASIITKFIFPAITDYRMAGKDYGFDDIVQVSDLDPILYYSKKIQLHLYMPYVSRNFYLHNPTMCLLFARLPASEIVQGIRC
jgi:hypothetical protein